MAVILSVKENFMLQVLPKNGTLTPNTSNPHEAVEFINSYIDKFYCETMRVDISFMNILDACYVSTICSAKHYVKYPQGKINWKISSELVKELNHKLELGNSDYIL